MASSQVEIASSSPFGCVLRNHTRKERCREINVRALLDLDTNFKGLMTHVATSTNERSNIGNHRNLHTTNIKNGEPSPITPKHSPLVLDRWVTRQAQDVTTDKHVVNEGAGQLLVPTNSNTASPMASNLSTPLENVMVKHNLGASSLVQIWEARLHRSYQGQSMGSDTSRTNPGSSSNENNINASSVEEASTLDEKIENRRNNDPEDSLIDCDTSAPPFCSSCDAGERERVRVADIIKRLKNGREDADDDERINTNVTDSQSRENKHSSTSDQGKAGRRYFLRIASSPRLRGRQAFYDLLMQIERDKNRELDSLMERRSVSKFSQRGRLQSMLRLRCLQRSLTIQDKCHPQGPGVHGTRFSHGSTMMQAREKFSTGAAQNDSATSRCLHRDQVSTQLDKSSTSKLQINRFTEYRNENLNEQAKPASYAIHQKETSLEVRCLETLKSADTTTPLASQSENQMAKEQGSNCQQNLFLDSQGTAENVNPYSQNETAEERDNHQQHLSLGLEETTETSLNEIGEEQELEQDIDDKQQPHLDSQENAGNSTFYSDNDGSEVTEELDDHYPQYFDQTNYDRFSDISRPRMLNTTSKNEEIRQLLERGRVSTCLASDFRERMDRLMNSRVQIMQEDGGASQEEADDEDRMVQVKSCLQRHLHPAGDLGVEEEEEMSIISHQSHEAHTYFNQSPPSIQMPSPSDLTRSWNSQDGKETGNYSDRGPSTFSPPSGVSEAQYYQDTRRSSCSIAPTSLEIELICDLRGHIEQLQREMGELSKSILSCMDLQMKFQHYSFNRELLHSGGREENKSTERVASPWKRCCCICLEMQVDSLLYSCGHMCTCLKCAHELQWSSGKCPKCTAPILDVVPIK
ncbi:hypothetical protein ES319_D02G273600v1 [Gossypium barbadense]|uniref:RING-type domain-containing protein n=1 Tax=Gossypium barbadense TaxID=3634 RepID=A0A5J5SIB1_GOSBA|nr:hypothetical protein ES319_D02G273600v1 [Gossypium barbadense]